MNSVVQFKNIFDSKVLSRDLENNAAFHKKIQHGFEMCDKI